MSGSGARAVQRVTALAGIDPAAPQQYPPPSAASVVAATVASLGVSLGLDAALVAAGTAVFPATRGFRHFRFTDYGLLTTIGVLAACAAWPLVVRASARPRWLLLRLAVLVTLVLLLPDAWILARGETPDGVAVLVVMHLVIAVVTYNALVRIARPPARVPSPASRGAPARAGSTSWEELARRRGTWVVMLCLLGVEFALGVVALLAVPSGRPSGWVPSRGAAVYAVHSVAGALLALGAVALVVATRHGGRAVRTSAVLGAVGVFVGAAGGVLTVYHPVRLVGMALMFVGAAVALMGYVMPAAGEPSPVNEAGAAPPASPP